MPVREVRTALAEQERRERHRGETDRDVHEEDPRPVQVRGQDAAEQHAGGGAAAGGRAVDAERAVPLLPLGEGRHQQRQRGRREQRPAEPLDGAERDQRGLGPGQAARERARREEREPGDEHTPASQQVADASPEEQRAAEEDRVGRDDPLQARAREPEVRLDRRQRHVHDCHVEDHHELRGDEQGECAPTPPCRKSVDW